ncbi:MRC1 [Branchiostoma lanceolatum]|uniref:MRC1 protein n=1 Tax=Branchiostoma lanceolatum TaxID=7740 RepID=A0A8K0ETI6_BRALA|nr:MRC1 [Branchiostoma lanceolatum]
MWRHQLQIVVGFLIVSSKFVKATSFIGDMQACESGWTEYRGACFKLFAADPVMMGSAQGYCGDSDAAVVQPKTFGIQALVHGMMIGHPEDDYWMSMIHNINAGGWLFMDGTRISDCDWTNWGPASNGEASSSDAADGEQCAIMAGATGWAWEDSSCISLGSYICQSGDVTGTSDGSCGTATENNSPCPSGWTVGPGDLCYKVSATVATFADAEADCASQGGRLAAPYDERTHQFIAGMAMLVNPNSDHWIGIVKNQGAFIGVEEIDFSDGQPMGVCEYQNFKPDHPGEGSCCGFMDSTDGYQWGFGGQAGPDTELHYVCQTGTDYVCSVTEAAAAGCPVTEFTCPCPVPGGCCIIDDWVCDDFDDCMDNSDEALCQIEGEGDWIDVRNYWVLEWIGTDPGSAVVDTFRHTIWNAGGQDQYFNNWYIIMDFQVPHTIQHVRIINYGDLIHDVEAFRLDASPSAEPYQWDTVYSNGDVGVSHSIPQVFSGFSGSGRYWRFTCTKTYEGWQPWVKDLKFHGYVFIGKSEKKDSFFGVFKKSHFQVALGAIRRSSVRFSIEVVF